MLNPDFAKWPTGLLAAIFGPNTLPETIVVANDGATITLKLQGQPTRVLHRGDSLYTAVREQLRRDSIARRSVIVVAENHIAFLIHDQSMAKFVLCDGVVPNASYLGSVDTADIPALFAYALYTHNAPQEMVDSVARSAQFISHAVRGSFIDRKDSVSHTWSAVRVPVSNNTMSSADAARGMSFQMRHLLGDIEATDGYNRLLVAFADSDNSNLAAAAFARRRR
jgi:hypothetical protein